MNLQKEELGIHQPYNHYESPPYIMGGKSWFIIGAVTAGVIVYIVGHL